MDTIPKVISCLFLFRTLKTPLTRIAYRLSSNSTPILALCFFLLGEFGIWGIPKILPVLLSIIWTGQTFIPHGSRLFIDKIFTRKLDKIPISLDDLKQYIKAPLNMHLLSTTTNAVSFLTGWSVAQKSSLVLPIDYFLSNMLVHPLLAVLLIFTGAYITKYNQHIALIMQLAYLSLFLGNNHLSYIFMFSFIIIGLLTRKDQVDMPYFSYYLVESILTVGTLFTTTPTNIVFAIGSILLIWQLTKINDKGKYRKKSDQVSPSGNLQTIETTDDEQDSPLVSPRTDDIIEGCG